MRAISKRRNQEARFQAMLHGFALDAPVDESEIGQFSEEEGARAERAMQAALARKRAEASAHG
jgi:hypothetical protein